MPYETVTIFTTRNGLDLHIELPSWYLQYAGNVTVRTPDSTHVVYNKDSRSNRPFTEEFLQQHYLSKSPSYNGEKLESNQVSLKRFGGEEQVFEVLVTESVVEEYCSGYPPLTVIDSR